MNANQPVEATLAVPDGARDPNATPVTPVAPRRARGAPSAPLPDRAARARRRVDPPTQRALALVGDPMELEGPAMRAAQLARAVASRVRSRPWASLAAALGAGFVVGGALSFRAGRIALAAAARRIAREVLKQVL